MVDRFLFSGLRQDGRRPKELRLIECEMGVEPGADGSAVWHQGNTVVYATVQGPKESTFRSRNQTGRAQISVEFFLAPFSGSDRRVRSRFDRRNKEIAQALQQTLQTAIVGEQFPRSQISININVVQADGGVRSAAMNAATLALVDAGIPMHDFVACCSAGFLQDTAVLDPNSSEEGAAGGGPGGSASPDLPVALFPASGEISLLQLGSQLPCEKLADLMQLASEGCQQIAALMRECVTKHVASRLRSRETVTRTD
ncbi:putative Exosome complex component RRP41 [Paratrimastix pyriformis]|uniref:Exosome complex component RRP41 n=1 Tax=Paratrimastix pyriformis TaxID=342808 RepID=A0ABQ8UI16_9EUKA|nr:putative Exosome complex component RRP41 [Paratrimastix pyriformis]